MTEREDIDDTLLEKALRIGGLKTREETVNQALREFIERREAEKLIAPSAPLTLMKAMITRQKETVASETSRMAERPEYSSGT